MDAGLMHLNWRSTTPVLQKANDDFTAIVATWNRGKVFKCEQEFLCRVMEVCVYRGNILNEAGCFVAKKLPFAVDAGGVADGLAICAPYAVAGDDDGDGVVGNGSTYGLGGGCEPLLTQPAGQVAVCCGFAIGYLQ